ncbi:MAG: efflux transporter outer membrane subunit, partial [Verrucomicrobiae bacterium]|nr:efflux transporter outer membrane subunit [Verrucomicrobiae bacterium]
AQLNQLVQQALAGNFTVRRALARLEQAEWSARKAGASLWPVVDGEVSAARRGQRANDATSYASRYRGALLAGYELDLWGRVRATRAAAWWEAQASREDLATAAISVSASVAITWFNLVEQRAQVQLVRDQLQVNEALLGLVRERFQRGQVGAADLLQQQQLVEARRGDLASAELRAQLLAHQLAGLIGQPPGTLVWEDVSRLPDLPALPATGVPAELVGRRPDVRAAANRLQAAERRVAVAVADRFPRLRLTGEWETGGTRWRDLFDNWLATLAANLTAPLWDAGERRAEVARAWAVWRERLHEYGQTLLEAFTEVEDALVTERQLQRLLESVDRQVELAGRVVERLEDSYRNGAVDYQRVLTAVLTHQSLQRQQLTVRRQVLEARVGLYRALAGGVEGDLRVTP